jgi:3-isopropylmalate dehydrogenase
MLRHSLNQPAGADRIERAVEQVLDDGYRTPDIQESETELVGCCRMGELVRSKIERAEEPRL